MNSCCVTAIWVYASWRHAFISVSVWYVSYQLSTEMVRSSSVWTLAKIRKVRPWNHDGGTENVWTWWGIFFSVKRFPQFFYRGQFCSRLISAVIGSDLNDCNRLAAFNNVYINKLVVWQVHCIVFYWLTKWAPFISKIVWKMIRTRNYQRPCLLRHTHNVFI